MYQQGHNRLFFQSQKDVQQDVNIKIVNPSLKKFGPWPMCFLENGLYYIDIWFRYRGSYVFYVFENGEKAHQDILLVSVPSHIVYPNMDRLV